MTTLNVSLPEQLKNWVIKQVVDGRYTSESDYLCNLIRKDIHQKEEGAQWLTNQLKPLVDVQDEDFVSITARDIKKRARRKIEEKSVSR